MMLNGGWEAILLRRMISSLLGGFGISFTGDVYQVFFLYSKTEMFLVNEDLDPTDLICDLVTVMSRVLFLLSYKAIRSFQKNTT